jgi:hypothetical protein
LPSRGEVVGEPKGYREPMYQIECLQLVKGRHEVVHLIMNV